MEEFTKDFWIEVQKNFLKDESEEYFCHTSDLFKYYWTKPDGVDREHIRQLASNFLIDTNNNKWTADWCQILFESLEHRTPTQMRQIRIQFLEWIINRSI